MGIEALRGGASDLRAPTRVSDLWYLARGLRNRSSFKRTTTPAALLQRALTAPHLASVLTTTTRIAHLEANIAVVRALHALGELDAP
jgi:aryl-alcohol dehydrogenase-like predicted oxidoreductase